jgi:hypothetical protein
MDYEGAKAKLVWYVTYSGRGDEVVASEIYTDDAVLEFPSSGERFRGKANFVPWRAAYPATKFEFELRTIRGEGDTWIIEGTASIDGGEPWPFVEVLHFRGDLVDRETIYAIQPFPPEESRAKYADQTEPDTTPGLPMTVRSGD